MKGSVPLAPLLAGLAQTQHTDERPSTQMKRPPGDPAVVLDLRRHEATSTHTVSFIIVY